MSKEIPEQLELRAPPSRGGPMTDFDWRVARSDWKMFFPAPTEIGQIKKTRTTLQLSSNEIARRLGVTTGAFAGYEKREKSGRIYLATLRRIARRILSDAKFRRDQGMSERTGLNY